MNDNNLEYTQIEFEPASCFDQAGRIFYHQERVFRGILKEHTPLVREILNHPRCEAFFNKGLIPTRVSDVTLDGYEVVLEHQKVPFVSYCMEWSPVMLKDAALMICDLSYELALAGFTLKDAHPWNVLFNKCKPVFVDIGSIIRIDQAKSWPYKEFKQHILFPLWLFYKGYQKIAYQMLKEHPTGTGKAIIENKILSLLPIKYTRLVTRYLEKKRANHQQALIDFLGQIRTYISNLNLIEKKGAWSNYEQKNVNLADPEKLPSKAVSVLEFLKNLDKGTLLDMACNRGEYSYLAAELGFKVIAFDNEASLISDMYLKNKTEDKDILPLKMDFLWPTSCYGLGLSMPTSFERFKCDTTLVLALVHHLVFKQKVNFEVIARIIDRYAGKNAIVEFIPHDDFYVSKWMTEKHGWYTLENFIRAMKVYFNKFTVVDSSPPPRKIILFQKSE